MNPSGREEEIRHVARGGLMSFGGAATSAIAGFVLTVVLARLLGDDGAGVVLQVMAVFTIAFNLVKLGTDTGVLWLVPRLEGAETARLRGALVAAIGPVAAAGTLVGAGLVVAARALRTDGPGTGAAPAAEAIGTVGWFVPCAAIAVVLLAAVRALGEVREYVLLFNVGLPVARLVGVATAGAVGAGAIAASIAWVLPLPVLVVIAGAIVLARVRKAERRAGAVGRWRPDTSTAGRLWRFSLPRSFSAMLEKSLLWLDVVLVGTLLGPAAAGVYGTASRFVAAGLIAETALRVVVAPRFSTLLARGARDQVQRLYNVATTWVLLCSAPVYLMLALFAPVVLALMGPGFARGAVALAILCGGMLVSLAAGNVQSVLLMSGRSGWQTVNRVLVLAVNVAGNLLLLPVWGITGAACAWAVSMVLDAGLAAAEVAAFVGVRPRALPALRATLPAAVCYLGVGVPLRLAWGASLATLVVAGVAGTALFAVWCWKDRRRLAVDELVAALRGRSAQDTAVTAETSSPETGAHP